MRNLLKSKLTYIAMVPCLGAVAFLNGCGGGGGGSEPSVPTIYDGTYAVTFVPDGTIPRDGTVPTGDLTITNGRATADTTFFLQPSVVKAVQDEINKQLTKAGYPGDIVNNQLPSNVTFALTARVDGSGKTTLLAKKGIPVCGTGTFRIDPTLAGLDGSGTGTYQVTFPDYITIKVRGTNQKTKATTCNNLKLRSGKVTFARTSPTPVLTPIATATTTATATATATTAATAAG